MFARIAGVVLNLGSVDSVLLSDGKYHVFVGAQKYVFDRSVHTDRLLELLAQHDAREADPANFNAELQQARERLQHAE